MLWEPKGVLAISICVWWQTNTYTYVVLEQLGSDTSCHFLRWTSLGSLTTFANLQRFWYCDKCGISRPSFTSKDSIWLQRGSNDPRQKLLVSGMSAVCFASQDHLWQYRWANTSGTGLEDLEGLQRKLQVCAHSMTCLFYIYIYI